MGGIGQNILREIREDGDEEYWSTNKPIKEILEKLAKEEKDREEESKQETCKENLHVEISDEEIENAWEEFRIHNPNTVGGFQDQYASFSFAIKWYKERLKNK